jgi:Signal transduction histidine kinase
MQIVNIIIKIACFIILTLTNIVAFSQDNSDKHYLFQNYNTRNGLINNNINTIKQDKNGFIWIGSNVGLTRFDGKSFFHNTIPDIYNNSATVHDIETTDKGNIINTAFMQGIYVQLDDGSFKNYSIIPDSINRNSFHTVKQFPDGGIIIGGSTRIYMIDNDKLKLIYNYNIDRLLIADLVVDNNNNIWFGGVEGLGYMEFSDFEYQPVFIPELKDISITKTLIDEQGVMHVATSNGFFRIVFDNPANPGSKYTISQPFEVLSTAFINYIYIDREQNLWIPTSSDGVYRTKGDSISLHLTIDNGLLSASVLCVFQDREESYWFGTTNGISMIENFDSYALAKNGKLFLDYENINVDKYGRLLIHGSNTFHIFQNGHLSELELKNTPLEKTGISYVTIDNNSVMWFVNFSELYRLQLTESIPDFKKAERVADLSLYNQATFRSISVDSNGIWLAASRKIFNYHQGRISSVTFNHPDSLILRPQVIKQDHLGHYWIGDYKNGLYRADLTENSNNTIIFDNIIAYKFFNPDSDFETMMIRDLEFDKEGNLWVASKHAGAYKHKINNSGIVSSKLYSIQNGLLSNLVSGIVCKDDGRIWINSSNGISILTQEADGSEHFNYLGKKEGFDGEPKTSIESDDNLFVLTDEAFFVTSKNIFDKNIVIKPNVIITRMSVNGEDKTKEIYKNKTLFLGNNQNNIAFEFSSVIFRSAVNVLYQYKLEDVNGDWSELSERSFVEYSSLKPGKYSFNVRAITDDGKISDVSTFRFKINNIYYQTFWFYLILCILVSITVYILYKNHIDNVIKTERIRSRIAADLHDDIGSTLSSIFLLSEISINNNKISTLENVLRKISENSREILNSMDDIIWSVKPQDDSLASLFIRLREFAIPLCESKGISLYLNIEPSANSLNLEMDVRRNIYLITKESINNAIKHSNCTKLEITFSVNNRHLEVVINDNGIGFDPKPATSRNGMINMKRRAQQIGRELVILSEKSKGTTIRLKAKY